MSDNHQLPLVPHDLPALPYRRVRVYKAADGWTWEHVCPWRPASQPAFGYLHWSHKIALRFALEHVRCCL